MKAEDRSFVLNDVLPKIAVGAPLNSQSTSAWVRGLLSNADEELTDRMRASPSQWSVDLSDVAILYVAALPEPDIQNQRIFAFAETFNYSMYNH